MIGSDAELEFGLVFDSQQQGFDVTLRFTSAAGEDRPERPREPVHIDLGELNRLVDDDTEYGRALASMLFRPPRVHEFYTHAIAAAQRFPLHVRIHLDAPARYHSVRWELLRELGDNGTAVAAIPNIYFSRFLSSTEWRPVAVRGERHRRALVAVAAPVDLTEYGLAVVDRDSEVARAREALRDYEVTVPGRATLEEIVRRLETDGPYEVLYIVAHGRLNTDVPSLYLEGETGLTDAVDARRLVERIHAVADKPTLAVLMSCQSADAGDAAVSSDGGALAGLGPRLAGVGVPAVIAMQGNVRLRTAQKFVTALFTSFTESPVIDRAVGRARAAVLDEPDWWTPVLFSRLRWGRVYHPPAFTTRDTATWQELDVMLGRGRVTPVLGPGLAESITGSRAEIARRWVRRWQMPITLHEQSNLAQVAQYLRVGRSTGLVRAYLEEYLMTDLRERREDAQPGDPLLDLPAELLRGNDPLPVIHEIGRRSRERDPGEPYRVAAALPVPVFVTTGWTDLLQNAMRARVPAKQPRTFCFPWYPKAPWADIDGVDVSAWERPTVERPWVCHLFGRLDRLPSLVLTEDDYFTWLSEWIEKRPSMPQNLSALSGALTQNSLLFLGYNLGDWDFRMVFQSIRTFGGAGALLDNQHIGVQLRPETASIEPEAAQRYLESHLGSDNVNIFWSDTRRFLDELRTRTELTT